MSEAQDKFTVRLWPGLRGLDGGNDLIVDVADDFVCIIVVLLGGGLRHW